jgi:hypothetical protein
MNQILHIFRKDVRHNRLQIAAYASVLILFAIIEPTVATGIRISNPVLPLLISLLQFLIPACWVIIIVRVVHAESLVGDRQFWITRPYRWQSLLAEKALFIALILVVPYLAMQCFMVARAGLTPFNSGLVMEAVRFCVGVWIPIFAVASVSSTLGTAVATVMGVLVVWASGLSFLVGRDGPRTDAPYSFAVLSIIFTAIFIAVLIEHYRRRNLQGARAALLSVVVLFLALFVGYVQMSAPFVGHLLMRAQYPAGTAPELHLAFREDLGRPRVESKSNKPDAQLRVSLPIQLEGLDAAKRLINLNSAYTIDVNGEHYTSPWRPVALLGGGISLLIPHELLDRAAGSPAHLRLTLDGTVLNPADTRTATLSDKFAIAGNGACGAIDVPGNFFRCAFAFHVPNPIRIEPITPPGCRTGQLQSAAVHTQDGGATIINPVQIQVMNFGGGSGTDCRVTAVRSTLYQPAKNFSTTLDIPAVNLNNYIDL